MARRAPAFGSAVFLYEASEGRSAWCRAAPRESGSTHPSPSRRNCVNPHPASQRQVLQRHSSYRFTKFWFKPKSTRWRRGSRRREPVTLVQLHRCRFSVPAAGHAAREADRRPKLGCPNRVGEGEACTPLSLWVPPVPASLFLLDLRNPF